MYTFDYEDTWTPSEVQAGWAMLTSGERVWLHLEVYCLADAIGMPHLKDKASEKIAAMITAPDLTSVEQGSSLADIVEVLYSPMSKHGLGKALVEHLVKMGACKRDSPFRDTVLNLAKGFGEFAADLIELLGERE